MAERSTAPENSLELKKRSLFTPDRIALVAMWLLTTVSLVIMLFSGVRNTDQFRVERYILQVAYVAALLWFLSRTGPSVKQLPDVGQFFLPGRRTGKLIPAILIALLLVAAFFRVSSGIVMLLPMVATVWILIVWRREIRLLPIFLGLLVALIALLGGLPFWEHQFVGKSVFIGFLVFAMPMFLAGGLLFKRTRLGGSQLYMGQYRKALWSFLVGCLLFVPFGLINAATGSPGTGISWVTHLWMPFSLPWFSGIAEEVLYRLLLVTLCYFMLRPAFNKFPAVAVVLSALFSGIIFGSGHGGSLMDRFLTTGVLYGLPLAVLYVRRDWEHAVGAHYMINMIPWMMVFLQT